MKIRTILVLVVLFSSLNLIGQNRIIYGRVISDAEYGNQILDPSLIWEWNPILIH